MGAFPKDADGKMLFSDVDYIETYKVKRESLIYLKHNIWLTSNQKGHGRAVRRGENKKHWR